LRRKDNPERSIIACSDDAEVLTFDKDSNSLKELEFKIAVLDDGC